MNLPYNLQFEKLCSSLKLGKLVTQPEELSGGLLHRMFAVETTTGKYAIKALNPQIMARPSAFNNFINSEKIVNIAASRIPAHPAKQFNGTSMQWVEHQFYLVFDWIEGRSLKAKEITPDHCKRIGALLAELHLTDYSNLDVRIEHFSVVKDTDWSFYIRKGKEAKALWVNQLNEQLEALFTWSAKTRRSSEALASDQVIGHRDLEPKNVMWSGDQPIIIDWESAGTIHPLHDMVETSIYWSTNASADIDKEKFLAFLGGYQEQRGRFKADWLTVLNLGYLSKLDWLEYSLRRSLWMECSDEREQQLGTEQVVATLSELQQYNNTITLLNAWLNEI